MIRSNHSQRSKIPRGIGLLVTSRDKLGSFFSPTSGPSENTYAIDPTSIWPRRRSKGKAREKEEREKKPHKYLTQDRMRPLPFPSEGPQQTMVQAAIEPDLVRTMYIRWHSSCSIIFCRWTVTLAVQVKGISAPSLRKSRNYQGYFLTNTLASFSGEVNLLSPLPKRDRYQCKPTQCESYHWTVLPKSCGQGECKKLLDP